MKPVRIVFESRGTWRSQFLGHGSRVRLLALTSLVVAVASSAAVAWQVLETREQVRGAQDALVALRAQRGQTARHSTAGGIRPTLSVQQRREWNLMTRHLNTPWPAVLDALETTTPESVALVTIEPDPQHGVVRLQAEAKTLDSLLQYAQLLTAAEPFNEVTLLKHETNERDATRPVRLSMAARLQGRKRDERSAREPSP